MKELKSEIKRQERSSNEQGYTLGKYAEVAQKLGFGLVINHVHGILTDSMYDKALQKLQKEMVKRLRRMGENNENDNN